MEVVETQVCVIRIGPERKIHGGASSQDVRIINPRPGFAGRKDPDVVGQGHGRPQAAAAIQAEHQRLERLVLDRRPGHETHPLGTGKALVGMQPSARHGRERLMQMKGVLSVKGEIRKRCSAGKSRRAPVQILIQIIEKAARADGEIMMLVHPVAPYQIKVGRALPREVGCIPEPGIHLL